MSNNISLEHKFCKKLGQNFLIDDVIIHQIIKFIDPQLNQVIIEIGPGLGAITTGLIDNCYRLLVVEIDRNLSIKLATIFKDQLLNRKLFIINQDILKLNFLQVVEEFINDLNVDLPHNLHKILRIVGNLPYNISSPLLFKLFNFGKYFKDGVFMLQKEFAERLVAKPNSKKYGKLSVMAQYHAKIDIIFNVNASAFKPEPKVNSSIINIIPYSNLPYESKNYPLFQELVNLAFSQKRKILSNSLKKYCSEDFLRNLNIDPLQRPEQLKVADFVKISNSIILTS